MGKDSVRDPSGQALAVPAEPANGLGPSGFDPSRYEALFDETVRLEQAWPFPMTPAPEALTEAFAEALDCRDFPEPLKALVAYLSEDERGELLDGGYSASEIFEEICGSAFRRNVFGWIGIAATPVFKRTSARSSSFSWGHYHTQLIFAANGDALIDAAVAWAKERHTADTAEQAA